MKHIGTTSIILALLAVAACEPKISEPVDFNVTLDESNTYYAGDPVKFNLGNAKVDNLLFYSGENGSQYQYKDRYTVNVEDVNSASLNLKYQARYGNPDGLSIYVSSTFPGLAGDDGAADRATIKALEEQMDEDGNIPGWTKLDYQEGGSTVWTQQSYDMNDFLDNLCIAVRWHPIRDGKSAQRTYWVSGSLVLDIKGTSPSSVNLADFKFKTVMINEEIADPYMKNNGNGSIILNKPTTADLIFQGVGPLVLDYAIDGWAISTPTPLNKVANDKGTIVKNIQNYMRNFEYIYAEPGTYTATFVGINSDYTSTTKDVQEVKVIISERPE